MKKEVTIAIIIGLILGLVVTFGIYTARKGSSFETDLTATPNPGSQPNVSPNSVKNSLVISSPEDGLITADKELQVSGTTDPNAFIFIFFADQFKVDKADATGNFSTTIPTRSGPMLVVVRAVDEAGNTAEDERSVFIGDPQSQSSSAPIAPPASPVPSPNPTSSPKTIIKVSSSSAKTR